MIHTIELKGSGTLQEIIDCLEEAKLFIECKIENGDEGYLDEATSIPFPMGVEGRDEKLYMDTRLGKYI